MAGQPISGKGSLSIGPFTINFESATVTSLPVFVTSEDKEVKKRRLHEERENILARLGEIKRELDTLGP